jgi:DNA polymerase V
MFYILFRRCCMRDESDEEFPRDPRDLRQRGFKSGAYEYIGQVLSLSKFMDGFIRNPAATYYWWVRGSEARLLGLREGDLMVVDRSLKPRHGSLVVCVVNRKFRVRRMRRWGDTLAPVPLKNSTRCDPLERVRVWGVISLVLRDVYGSRAG